MTTRPLPALRAVQVLNSLAHHLLPTHDVFLYYGREGASPSLAVRCRDSDRAMTVVASTLGYFCRENSRWIGELQSPIACVAAIESMLLPACTRGVR